MRRLSALPVRIHAAPRASAAILVALAAGLLVGCDELGSVLVVPQPDASTRTDAGALRLDAGGADAAVDAGEVAPDAGPDAGTEAQVDAGPGDAGALTPDAGACDPGLLGDPDRARVMLLGHPFGATSSNGGREIRSLSLGASGTPVDDGVRLDVGVRPKRIAFVPDGSRALVLGEDGMLVSVAVAGPRALAVIDRVMLPAAGFGDLVITSDGFTAWVVGSDVAETSGVSTVHLACDGTLSVESAKFYNLRLASALALLPGETRAVLLGGQTVFEPIDPLDVRLLTFGGSGWSPVASFDIWTDFIDAGNIAVSPDGATLLMPNGSPFSNEGSQLSIAHLAGDVITEVDRLMNLEDIRQVAFSPDGTTALATQLGPGRVVALADLGAGLAVQQTVRGIGLAEDLAMVRRGALSGRVYVPSVDSNGGPNVAMLRIDGPGRVTDLGQVELGSGNLQIPGPIAITP